MSVGPEPCSGPNPFYTAVVIEIRGITKSFGAQVLFRRADLRVGARDRLALVGPNGSGKTTLLEMIVGEQRPDAGAVQVTAGARLGYLPQETDALRGKAILEEVISAAPSHGEVKARLEVLEHEIAEADDGERDELLAEYARIQQHFDELGGWTAETDARRILSGLGFRDADLERRTETLSGGWLMRVALAKLLLAAPDALLLDEPTNHLDLLSVEWLERFLSAYDGTVLMISHDRDFMNGFASRVVEIEDGELVSYTGNYASFVQQRTERAERLAATARNQAKRVAEIETFVNRFRYKASKARQVQSRIKMLDKMERVEAPRERRRRIGVGFPAPPRSGRIVLELDGVRFGYDGVPVYDGLDLEVERGEKVALVGPNGAGKTTLLKLAAGALHPQGGERHYGQNVAVGYFAQHTIEALDPGARVIEEMQQSIPRTADVRARDLLGRFLFSGDDADKPVSVLSGGERTRLALAKLLVSPLNLLCLDEPTNHLDVQSRDALEQALDAYDGSIILITHDRHLIRSIANRVIEVRSGAVRSFPGDYDYYLWRTAQEKAEQAQEAEPAPQERPAPAAREHRRSTAADRADVRKQRAEVRKVERSLEQAHGEAERLSAVLADPGFYSSGEDVAGTTKAYEDLRTRIAELEREWERLTEGLEA